MKLVASMLAGTLVTTSGCSWIFMNKPPASADAQLDVDCTESRTAPVVDTVFAALYVIGMASTLATGGSSSSGGTMTTSTPTTGIIISGLITVGIFGASAYSGYSWAARCRRMHGAHDDYEEGLLDRTMDPAPGTRGHQCRKGRGCDVGLECAQGRCLELQH